MKIGVVFPQTEIDEDAGGIREYAQAAEEMGFSHILAFDHVLGASRASRPVWNRPYDLDSMFHEPFVLFGYIAGVTKSIGLCSGIVILPQRQAALVAKQAAAVDVLSNGRLRLGVGIGWNDVEYEALGMNFHNRGRRCEEQIEVMRQLWTKRAVTFKGKWHTITDAGIFPLPVQRPIPVWFGGMAEQVVDRVARTGDGWLPQFQPGDAARQSLEQLRSLARKYGRDPATIGVEGRMTLKLGAEAGWESTLKGWKDLGATYVSLNTMGNGLKGPEAHIKRLESFRRVVPRVP
ncbi:MAG: LLM class F420-dependent oxidoreductase [Chloroflexi bacterium]|nr:LLM class F420-dependent oxidoreductase [Chloroflexota bacterium]